MGSVSPRSRAGRIRELGGSDALVWGVFLVGLVAFAVETAILSEVPPASGFENSPLAAYPPAFWACFLIALAASILTFLGAAIRSSRAWKPAFGLLAANYGIFFYLPVHRGYELYDRAASDSLAHLGFVKRALSTGSLSELFYPLEHAFLSTLAFLGVPLDIARYTLSFGLTLVFILSVGLLLRELSGNDDAFPVGLAVATPLVFTNFQVRINPAMMSFLFVPLFLVLIERARRVDGAQFRILYTVLALGLVLFHPMTAILLVVLLLSTAVFRRLYTRSEEPPGWPLEAHLAPLVGVVWFHWYSRFGRTRRSLRETIRGITTDTRSTIAADQANRVASVDFTPLELAIRFVQKYGVDFLYLAAAGLIGFHVLVRLRRDRSRFDTTYMTVQFFLGSAIALLFMLVYLIAFDPIRVSRYAIVMAVLLVGLVLHYSIRLEGKRARTITVVLTCVVLIAAGLGTVGGTTYWTNEHMTHAEYQGSEFVLEHHDPELPVRAQSLHVKMEVYVTGNRSPPGGPPVFRRDEPGYTLFPGLGYPENETAAEAYGPSYLVTQAYDTEFYRSGYYTENQRAVLPVYRERHLRRLARDPTAHRVYSNGEFTVWRVTGGG